MGTPTTAKVLLDFAMDPTGCWWEHQQRLRYFWIWQWNPAGRWWEHQQRQRCIWILQWNPAGCWWEHQQRLMNGLFCHFRHFRPIYSASLQPHSNFLANRSFENYESGAGSQMLYDQFG